MERATDRLEILIGRAGVDRLAAAKVVIVGLGGVGGQAAECIARSFVGRIVLIDGDRVAVSNINRQILSTAVNVGREKAILAAERARAISPDAEITALPLFLTRENIPTLDIWDADVILDVPAREAYRVQEYHLPIYHTLAMMLEERFYGSGE